MIDTPTRALTLHSPWPEAIMDHGKRVENRSWPIPSTIELPTWIAIHEGHGFDREGADFIHRQGLTPTRLEPQHPGHLIALVKLQSCLRIEELEQSLWADQLDWAGGPYCWCFDEIIILPSPIPARGAQRLWTLRQTQQDELSLQLETLERQRKRLKQETLLRAHIEQELETIPEQARLL